MFVLLLSGRVTRLGRLSGLNSRRRRDQDRLGVGRDGRGRRRHVVPGPAQHSEQQHDGERPALRYRQRAEPGSPYSSHHGFFLGIVGGWVPGAAADGAAAGDWTAAAGPALA